MKTPVQITKLEEQIQKGDLSAVNIFWNSLKKTPLVEPLENDQVLATFLWKASEPCQNVVLSYYGTASYDPQHNQMVQVPSTSIWYKPLVLHKDTRLVYGFSQNDPLIRIANFKLEDINPAAFTETIHPDPLNPFPYHLTGALCFSGQELHMSLLELAPPYAWNSHKLQGNIEEHFVPSTILQDGRQVDVYLPPNYDKNKTYPLLVSFDAIAFKDYVQGPLILDYLITQGKIPPTIALAIHNPFPNLLSRMFFLTCNDHFTHFVTEEVLAWAKLRYQISPLPQNRIITGGSLGALAACYTAFKSPEIFGNVLAHSGAFWWKAHQQTNYILRLYESSPKKDLRFFLDVGTLETAQTFEEGLSFLEASRQFASILHSKGYPVRLHEFWGSHDYISWQKAFAEAMVEFLG